MTNPSQSSISTRIKVGLFTLMGILFIGAMTIYVSHHPYWWRSCQLVHISVEDASGLKSKSPIKSLGLEIGYLETVDLYDTYVSLGICITAPVEVLPTTKAFIRTDGMLGDKFVELKPVRYHGPLSKPSSQRQPESRSALQSSLDFLLPAAHAESLISEAQAAPPSPSAEPVSDASGARGGSRRGREIPVGDEGQDVQKLMGRMDELVNQMTGLANNLKTGINPDELKKTLRELNKTLENASRTLAPEGGLNQTAQRTLAKLEDAIEQMRDMMTRVNKGEGSVGMLLNDPVYADEIREAVRNLNRLLTKVGDLRLVVTLGGQKLMGYEQSRGHAELAIWPKRDRYYLIGIAVDPRGLYTQMTQTTTAGGVTTPVQIVQRETTGFLPTIMFGKVFWDRLDLSIGLLYGDAALSGMVNLGWHGREDFLQLRTDVYTRYADAFPVNGRFSVILRPFGPLYVRAGLDGIFQTASGPFPLVAGAGISFDDEDIRLLFVLK